MIYIRNIEQKQEKKDRSHKMLHDHAYELLRQAVKEEYSQKADKLTMRVKEHGKPYFVERQEDGSEVLSKIQFNLSHSNEMVACVVCQEQVGIDIEKVRPFHPKIAEKILNEKEWEYLKKSKDKDRDFIRFWTLKEAYGKYLEKGLVMDLKSIVFSWQEDGEVICSDENVKVFQWEICGEYILALCIETEADWIKTLTKPGINDRIYTC